MLEACSGCPILTRQRDVDRTADRAVFEAARATEAGVTVDLAPLYAEQQVAVAEGIDRWGKQNRRPCGVDVADVVVETVDQLDAARANPQPIPEMIVEIEPVGSHREVSGGAQIVGKQLDPDAQPIQRLYRKVEPGFAELEASAAARIDQVIVGGALDVPLAHEAVHVDRRRTTWITDLRGSRL